MPAYQSLVYLRFAVFVTKLFRRKWNDADWHSYWD